MLIYISFSFLQAVFKKVSSVFLDFVFDFLSFDTYFMLTPRCFSSVRGCFGVKERNQEKLMFIVTLLMFNFDEPYVFIYNRDDISTVKRLIYLIVN